MADDSFFAIPTAASIKKHAIVSKYFGGWANIVLPAALKHEGAIKYVDLFCGPGRYRDGTPSIPLLILQHAIDTPALHETLHTVFNDENRAFVDELEATVKQLPGIERLKHPPVFRRETIGRDTIPRIENITIPTLFFADPWGYHGVSIDLIRAALTRWGSDILFFFNYNRINMNLTNDVMNDAINEFFTTARAQELRNTIARLKPADREAAILKAMKDSIKALKAKAELFTYRTQTGTRTSHHLICVSRHQNGIALFKEISAKQSSRFDDNVPSLEHNPASDNGQGFLFSPMRELEDELVTTFAGQQLTIDEVYHQHHNGKPYVLKNYRQAILHLEESGAVTIDPPRTARQQTHAVPTMAKVRFPTAS